MTGEQPEEPWPRRVLVVRVVSLRLLPLLIRMRVPPLQPCYHIWLKLNKLLTQPWPPNTDNRDLPHHPQHRRRHLLHLRSKASVACLSHIHNPTAERRLLCREDGVPAEEPIAVTANGASPRGSCPQVPLLQLLQRTRLVVDLQPVPCQCPSLRTNRPGTVHHHRKATQEPTLPGWIGQAKPGWYRKSLPRLRPTSLSRPEEGGLELGEGGMCSRRCLHRCTPVMDRFLAKLRTFLCRRRRRRIRVGIIGRRLFLLCIIREMVGVVEAEGMCIDSLLMGGEMLAMDGVTEEETGEVESRINRRRRRSTTSGVNLVVVDGVRRKMMGGEVVVAEEVVVVATMDGVLQMMDGEQEGVEGEETTAGVTRKAPSPSTISTNRMDSPRYIGLQQ